MLFCPYFSFSLNKGEHLNGRNSRNADCLRNGTLYVVSDPAGNQLHSLNQPNSLNQLFGENMAQTKIQRKRNALEQRTAELAMWQDALAQLEAHIAHGCSGMAEARKIFKDQISSTLPVAVFWHDEDCHIPVTVDEAISYTRLKLHRAEFDVRNLNRKLQGVSNW